MWKMNQPFKRGDIVEYSSDKSIYIVCGVSSSMIELAAIVEMNPAWVGRTLKLHAGFSGHLLVVVTKAEGVDDGEV